PEGDMAQRGSDAAGANRMGLGRKRHGPWTQLSQTTLGILPRKAKLTETGVLHGCVARIPGSPP
ncbi:MAG TPA: hypothetical protein VE687_04400, partial [Stellaceae bacterium]|nr:hypothetical protein [Stellaceae bacterium]